MTPDEVVVPRRQTLGLSAAVLLAVLLVAVLSGFRLDPPGAPFPPLLLWVLPVGSAVSLLFGFRAGNVAFLVCLVLCVVYARTHPPAGVQAATARFSLLLSLVTLQIFIWGFQSTFNRAKQLLRDQQRVLSLRVAEHARLVQTLVDDVQGRLAAMLPHFHSDRFASHESLETLRTQQAGLRDALRRSQQSLVSDERTALTRPELDFRHRVLKWILALTIVQLSIMLLRLALGIPGPALPGTGLLLVCLALLALLELRPRLRRWLALVFTLSSYATILAASAYWGYDGPPPGLVYVVTIAYHAVLIALPFSSTAVALLNLAVVGVAVSQGAASSLGASLFLFGVAACALAMQGYWYLMNEWVASSLRASEARWQELARVQAFRTRICGTLFHDVANLVQGMSMLVAFDDAGPEDARAFQRLHVRLSGLVTAVAETLSDEGAPALDRLGPVALGDVFREAEELFAFRLKEKGQTLECSLTEPLSVAAQPDLLRDSVIANLVSNAIKFSPRGAAIHLRARRKAGSVEISVTDQGPGIPSGLEGQLVQGRKVTSTQGSAGEEGLGLGLTLTREHLLRMGGSLALRRLPEGGSEALVELRSADA